MKQIGVNCEQWNENERSRQQRRWQRKKLYDEEWLLGKIITIYNLDIVYIPFNIKLNDRTVTQMRQPIQNEQWQRFFALHLW